MVIQNIVVIDGKEVLIETLPEEERLQIARNLNRIALEQLHYYEEETA